MMKQFIILYKRSYVVIEIRCEVTNSRWHWEQTWIDIVQSALTKKGADIASSITTITVVIIIIQIQLTSY
jgi:hypothetical protein